MDEVLAAVLGPGARTTGVLAGDGGAAVLAVTGPDGERLVVKCAPAGRAPDLLRAARAQEAARGAGVPVPRTVAARVVGGAQVHVTEHVGGRRWSDVHPGAADETRRVVLGALDDVLTRLRRVAQPGFGDLGDPPAGERDALLRRTRARVPGGWRLRAAERALDRHGALFDGSHGAVLVHGDLHHANVLVRPAGPGWVLAAVLDWDSAWAGPADADAARAALWDSMPGSPADADDRAAVQQLLWCLEYADGGARHRADTERLAARLGVAL
ncbi:phosphotransferase family protein [Cellulosimicrobium cellulans]|uniref:phosphotransferase family protein n=1 Tax=Cellulosimicrobium cellulans TaxID=1710 RepID=UPI001651EBFF|nr:phosphotransferase [Cellulosimicrobium cellulans]